MAHFRLIQNWQK